MRVKEILKEKGVSVQELADRMGVSRQALSKQIKGHLLVDTAESIAEALNVPTWQLFASPDEVGNTITKCPHCGREITIKIS